MRAICTLLVDTPVGAQNVYVSPSFFLCDFEKIGQPAVSNPNHKTCTKEKHLPCTHGTSKKLGCV